MTDEEKGALHEEHSNLLDNMLTSKDKSPKKPTENKWVIPNVIRETNVADEENEDFNETDHSLQ